VPDIAAPTLYVPSGKPDRPKTDPGRMSARAVLATEGRDRQGDVIVVAGIDLSAHRNNPVAMVDHGKWHPLPIGVTRTPDGAYTVEFDAALNVLWQETYFSQRSQVAEQVFALIDEGVLCGNSVGLRPIEVAQLEADPERGFHLDRRTGSAGRLVLRSELAEPSWCAIPVNGDAAHAAVTKSWAGRPLDGGLVLALTPYLPEAKEWANGWAFLKAWEPAEAPTPPIEPAAPEPGPWAYIKSWDESKHPRAADGKFGRGERENAGASQTNPDERQIGQASGATGGIDGGAREIAGRGVGIGGERGGGSGAAGGVGSSVTGGVSDGPATELESQLTESEMAAIRKYRGVFGTHANSSIQKYLSGEASDEDRKTIEALDGAIGKSRLSRPAVVYRGMRTDPFTPNGIAPRIGDEFAYNAFLSTSEKQAAAETFGKTPLLKISAPAGAEALHIDAATGDNFESEFLFPRHSILRIDAIHNSPDGRVYEASILGKSNRVIFPKRMGRKKAEDAAKMAKLLDEPIPDEVLADYPDLSQVYKSLLPAHAALAPGPWAFLASWEAPPPPAATPDPAPG